MSNAWMKGHRWFRVHTISMESNELKHSIEKKIQHPYVEKFVKKPFIDEDKLDILIYIYQDVPIPIQMKQQHIITIMLVQMALDTHEHIPNDHQDWMMSETERQLSVLAGDYYSGLYYLLLSELEEVNMIQVLASSIRKMNEYKMILFYEEAESVQEFIEVISQLEASLYTEVASYLGLDQQIVAIIQNVLLLNRLQREQNETNGIIPTFIANNSYELDAQDNVNDRMNNMIQREKAQLENMLLQLPYHNIQFENEIRAKFSLSYNTSIAEEG